MRLEDLYKKYPFVYKLDENYFFLGWGICKTCNSKMTIYYFEKYEELLQTIGEEKIESKSYDIEEAELEGIIKCFRKVKAYSDIAVSDEDMPVFRKNLNEFILARSAEQQEELLRQLKNFVNVFHYYYRSF